MKKVVRATIVLLFAISVSGSLEESVQSSAQPTRKPRKALLDKVTALFQEKTIKKIHATKKQVEEQKGLLKYYRGRITRYRAIGQKPV